MLKGFLGNKIGMTQIFDEKGSVIPVTVVACDNWYVTQIKTQERDGYNALQLGKLKKKFQGQAFSHEWLGKKSTHFSLVKEVKVDSVESIENLYSLGQVLSFNDFGLHEGIAVDVSAKSIGKGFQGVVKRWGFGGGPSAHGSMFHREPGAISHMRSRGRVIKGKRLPGQCGNRRVTVKGLKIVKLNQDLNYVLLKGSVPGKKNTLLHVHIAK